jgi:hypothetical protein
VEEKALISLSLPPAGRSQNRGILFWVWAIRSPVSRQRVRASSWPRDANKGLPMALHVHTIHPDALDEPAADRLGALYPDWSEHIVTIVAASLAVLVVALIAVVMGMA